ncbi:hypothetical protein [Vibrio sp. D431a]|uniref:hypothetical protein n=1 Tax=Vibrio sp. D431a TaxID=2837388 RepID=UPI0025521905|nr:hypothetical protein [Vibrio sp. D431a]MDK9793776.1 hypothetical protein [Vibrio sp. D431a]
MATTELNVTRTNHEQGIHVACIQHIHCARSWSRTERVAARKYKPVLMVIHDSKSADSHPIQFIAFGGVGMANQTVESLFGKGRLLTLKQHS